MIFANVKLLETTLNSFICLVRRQVKKNSHDALSACHASDNGDGLHVSSLILTMAMGGQFYEHFITR